MKRSILLLSFLTTVLGQSSCKDNPNYTFASQSLSGSYTYYFCDYISTNANKVDIRREKYCGNPETYINCYQSCTDCNCSDEPNFEFEATGSEKKYSCSWLNQSEKPEINQMRREKYCYEGGSGNMRAAVGCTASCNLCESEQDSPTTSPTKSPVTVVSPPTVVVQGGNSCSNNQAFTFESIGDSIGSPYDCEWLVTGNAEKVEKRKSRYCGNPEIYHNCFQSCSSCDCSDQIGFEFDSLLSDKKFTCDWLNQSEKPEVNLERKQKYCYKGGEGGMRAAIGCISSCGLCEIITSSPTDSPTRAPVTAEPTYNKSPSSSPSRPPSPMPSPFPTFLPTTSPSSMPSAKSSATPSLQPTNVHTAKPSSQPTKSQSPSSLSNKPSPFPSSDSLEPSGFPSKEPTSSPTKSIKPSPIPTKSPSTKPTALPSINGSDSPLRGLFTKNDGSTINRYCDWVSRKPEKLRGRCSIPEVKSHCCMTCGGDCDIDSIGKFKVPNEDGFSVTIDCEWVGRFDSVSRCALKGVSETCRSTCKLVSMIGY